MRMVAGMLAYSGRGCVLAWLLLLLPFPLLLPSCQLLLSSCLPPPAAESRGGHRAGAAHPIAHGAAAAVQSRD